MLASHNSLEHFEICASLQVPMHFQGFTGYKARLPGGVAIISRICASRLSRPDSRLATPDSRIPFAAPPYTPPPRYNISQPKVRVPPSHIVRNRE